MGELVNTIFLLAVGGFLASLLVMLLFDDDNPEVVVESKTLDIDGSKITVETKADGSSNVVAFHDPAFLGEPATAENGRLAKFWSDFNAGELRRQAK